MGQSDATSDIGRALRALPSDQRCEFCDRTEHCEISGTDGADCPSQETKEAPVSARSTGLALELDDGTRKSHSVAENTAFVTGFFKGIATKQSFARLVAGLYFVYDAMEDSFDTTAEPYTPCLIPSATSPPRRLARLVCFLA